MSDNLKQMIRGLYETENPDKAKRLTDEVMDNIIKSYNGDYKQIVKGLYEAENPDKAKRLTDDVYSNISRSFGLDTIQVQERQEQRYAQPNYSQQDTTTPAGSAAKMEFDRNKPTANLIPNKDKGFWDTYVGDTLEKIGEGATSILAGIPKAMNMPMKVVVNTAARKQGFDPQTRNILSDAIISTLPATQAAYQSGKSLDETSKSLGAKSNRYDGKDFSQLAQEGDYGGAIGQIFLEASKSLPMTLGVMLNPVGGMAAIGASTAGNKYDQLEDEQAQKWANHINEAPMSEFGMVINSVLTGGAEAGSEYLGSVPILKWLKGLFKTGGKIAVKETVKKGIFDTVDGLFKKYGLIMAPVVEGTEEFANTVAENTIDYLSGARPDFKPFENSLKSFVYGFGGGAQFSAVGGAKMLYDKAKGLQGRQPDMEAKFQKYMAEQERSYTSLSDEHGGWAKKRLELLKSDPRAFLQNELDIAHRRKTEGDPEAQMDIEQAQMFIDYLNSKEQQPTDQPEISQIPPEYAEQVLRQQEQQDPRQMVVQQAEQMFEGRKHKSGNVVTVFHRAYGDQPITLLDGEIQPNGEITGEDGDKMITAVTPDGRKEMVSSLDFVTKPEIISKEQHLSGILQMYDQEQQRRDLAQQQSFEYQGKKWIDTGVEQDGMKLIESIDDNFNPTGEQIPIPVEEFQALTHKKQAENEVQAAAQATGTPAPKVETAKFGKNQYEFTVNEDGTSDVIIPPKVNPQIALAEIQKHFESNPKWEAVPVTTEQVIPAADRFSEPQVRNVVSGVRIQPRVAKPQETPQNTTTTEAKTKETPAKEQKPGKYTFGKNAIDKDVATEIVNMAESYDEVAGLKVENDPELSNLIQAKFPARYQIDGEPATRAKVVARLTLGKGIEGITIENDSELNSLLSEQLKKKGITPPSNKTVPLKGVQDNTSLDPKAISDLVEGLSFGPQSFSDLNVEAKMRVKAFMLSVIDKPEVRKAIVGLVPIDVMNDIAGKNFSAEEFLNDVSVFRDSFPTDVNESVVGRFIDNLRSVTTTAAAKINIGNSGRNLAESNPTLITDDGNTDGQVGRLTLPGTEVSSMDTRVGAAERNPAVVTSDVDSGTSHNIDTSKDKETENRQSTEKKITEVINSEADKQERTTNEEITGSTENGNIEPTDAQQADPNPSEAQKKAGNYKKGHTTVEGMDISIENPAGSTRSGTDSKGNKWENTLNHHYGYFTRTDGKDGDQIDTFINPDAKDFGKVFVVDQNNPDNGEFDESKVMLGFSSAKEAREAYMSNYQPDWKGFRAITEVPVEDFKTWLYDGAKQRKPYSEYKDTPEPVEQPTDLGMQIDDAISKYDDTGEYTVNDIVDQLDGSGNAELQSAIDKYKSEVNQDFMEFGGRGDVETYEEEFLDEIGRIRDALKAKNEPQTPLEKKPDEQQKEHEPEQENQESPFAVERHPELKFLEEELPSRKPAKKDIKRLDPEEAEFRIKPIPVKVKEKSVESALEQVTADKDTRTPAMLGIYHNAEDQEKVATNGFIVTVIPTKVDGESRILMPNSKEPVDGDFPLYKKVIPINNPIKVRVKIDNIIDQINGARRANEFIDGVIALRLDDKYNGVHFAPKVLYAGLMALRETGTNNVIFEIAEPNRGIVVRDARNPKKFSLIMPLMGGGYFHRLDIGDNIIEDKPAQPVTPLEKNIAEKKEEKDNQPVAVDDPISEVTTENEVDVINQIEQEVASEETESSNEETPEEENTFDLESEENLEKLEDFGKKIGDARKDNAERGFKRRKDSDVPGWARKYNIGQDSRTKLWDIWIGKAPFFKVIKRNIETEDEAAAMLPLIEVSRRHRVYTDRDNKYGIYRKFSNNKTWLVQGGFDTRDEAMKYMAANAIEIINKKDQVFDRPYLEKVERKRKDWRNGKNATPEMFLNTFGFRGGEFGNWLDNKERQIVLNMAYDAFMDMAEILNVPPRALSLNGELSIGFGSRGHGGKSAAAAHYEPNRAVINLTRIKGAGTLMHEWGHALDHYLGILDGKASGQRKEDGTLPVKDRKNTYLSHGESLYPKSKVRTELLTAFNEVIAKIEKREVEKHKDINVLQARKNSISEQLDYEIGNLRGYISKERKYGLRKKPATIEQLAKFDQIASEIKELNVGESKFRGNNVRGSFKGIWAHDKEKELYDLYKEITGRSPSTNGNTGTLYGYINGLIKITKEIEEAEKDTAYLATVKTEYMTNSVEMDKGRASSYWSTPHEMFARALEAYIEDKTLATGENQYLVYGARNIFYEILGAKPYPEGQERIDINNAFDKFFSTIKTKEEGGQTVLFEPEAPYIPATIKVNGVDRPTTPLERNLMEARGNNKTGEAPQTAEDSQLSLFAQPNIVTNGKEYTTSQGEKIRYKATKDSYSDIVPGKADKQITPDNDILCAVERQMVEAGWIDLTGPQIIRGPEDVAFIFRNLEKATTENAFVVHHLPDGRHIVQYLSTGGTTGVTVDIKLIAAAAKEFGSESITFVHNHPSGNLVPSTADHYVHVKTKKMLDGIARVNDSVIIDLDRGMFGVFSSYDDPTLELKSQTPSGKLSPVRVYHFGKNEYYQKTDDMTIVTGSSDVGKYMSKIKRGTGQKYVVMVLNRRNQITRSYVSKKLPTAQELTYQIGKYGESVIIASNIPMDTKGYENIRDLKTEMGNRDLSILDVIEMETDPSIRDSYKSWRDYGLMEPEAEYTPLERQINSLGVAKEKKRSYSETGNTTEMMVEDPAQPITPAEAALERWAEKALIERNWKEIRTGLIEFWKDSDKPLQTLENWIRENGGVIDDESQPYRQITLAKGRLEALYDRFANNLMKPIGEVVAKIIKQTGVDGEMILPYTIAKHTLERNPDLRQNEIKNWLKDNLAKNDNISKKERKQLNEFIESLDLKVIPNKFPIDLTKEEETALLNFIDSIKNKDYSGIMPFDRKKDPNDPEKEISINGFTNPEELAQSIVDEVEGKIPEGLRDELWTAINNATRSTLEVWKNDFTMSEAEYNRQMARFQYFVPLRGWREGAANSLAYRRGEGFKSSLQRAQGRTSLAENPFAYIQQVHFQALGEQMDNEIRTQALNLFVNNAKLKGIKNMVTLKTAYYVKVENFDGTTEWELARDVNGDLVRPPQEMFDEGTAKMKVYSRHERLRTGRHADEHEVVIKGKNMDMILVFPNKHLEMAYALKHQNTMYRSMFTGEYKDAENFNKPLGATMGVVNNLVKAMYTSFNVVFPVTNLARDVQEGVLTQWIKGQSGTGVLKAYKPAFQAIYRNIKGKSDPTNEWDKLLERFYLTGGATGFTHLKDVQQIEKELNKSMSDFLNKRKIKGALGRNFRYLKSGVETWNRFFEDSTRFAIFAEAVKSGKTDREAASMAKEATVNFNRKGKITKTFDSIWAFWNVALESMFKNFKLAKLYPKKFTKVAAGVIASGFVMTLLNDLAGGGEGDDDDFYNVSDYARRNYLIIPTPDIVGKGIYIRIPIAQFWRGFYALGSLGYDLVTGKEKPKRAFGIAVSNFAGGLLPIDIGGVFTEEGISFSPIAPTVAKPFVEVIENRNFLGDKIYREPFTQQQAREVANVALGKENVNQAIKFATDMLFRATGGELETGLRYKMKGDDVKRAGWLDVNPSIVEHIFKGYTGGTGGVISDAVTTAIQFASPNQEVDFRNAPFVNAFVRKTPQAKWRTIREYYEFKSETLPYQSVVSGYKKNMLRTGDTEKYRKAYGNRYYRELETIIDLYDDIITLQSRDIDWKTAEGTEGVIQTMKDANDRIKKLKIKYDKE